MKTDNPMIRNKEAAELCCLSIHTLNKYRKVINRHKGLVEGIHWQSVNGQCVRWWQVPLEHWRDNRQSAEGLEIHHKWLEKRILSK